jgi:hypothetical protein
MLARARVRIIGCGALDVYRDGIEAQSIYLGCVSRLMTYVGYATRMGRGGSTTNLDKKNA